MALPLIHVNRHIYVEDKQSEAAGGNCATASTAHTPGAGNSRHAFKRGPRRSSQALPARMPREQGLMH
eukprot:5596095-Amphidinium_carterae.1